MRLIFDIESLREALEMSASEFTAASGIGSRTYAKIVANKQEWRLNRTQLEKLSILTFRAGMAGLPFSLEHNAIWGTFHDRSATFYRGTPQSDVDIESALSLYLKNIGLKKPLTHIVRTPPDPEEIRRAMMATNCIFVGGPKSNPATEVAMCLLYKAKPFEVREREKLPVHILGMTPEITAESTVLVGGNEHGFSVAHGKGRKKIYVHWVAPEDYSKARKDEGVDAAIVVVCRSPLGTEKPVTTVIIAGYRSLATRAVAAQLTLGRPPLDEQQLAKPGKVHLLGYRFYFRKPRGTYQSTADPRKEVRGTGKWIPIDTN